MKHKNEKGFTLTEVMVSATILGMGVMGMAAAQGVSMAKNMNANDMLLATNAAAEMMEKIESSRQYSWVYNTLTTGIANPPIGAPIPGNCAALPVLVPPPPLDAKQLATLPVGLQANIARSVGGDCTQWGARLAATGLQNVQGVVNINSLPPVGARTRLAIVQVNWTDREQGNRPRSVVMQSVIVSENGG